jgi:hypothetical protein
MYSSSPVKVLTIALSLIALGPREGIFAQSPPSVGGVFPSGATMAPIPLWKFSPDEKWMAIWVDDKTPPPFSVNSDDKGVTVAFAVTPVANPNPTTPAANAPAAKPPPPVPPLTVNPSTDVTCSLRNLLSREIEPIGIDPSVLSIDISSFQGNGLTIAPQVIDANGNIYQLTPKPAVIGTMTWDLHADIKSKVVKTGLEAMAANTTLTGPIYLDQILITKPVGPEASVCFTKGAIVDPLHGTMALGRDLFYHFDEGESWRDVNLVDRTTYTVKFSDKGMEITYGPATKDGHFILYSPRADTSSADFIGHPTRMITNVELVAGEAGSAQVGLGMVDSSNDIQSARRLDLSPGNNEFIWDSTDVSSRHNLGKAGTPDFPVRLDDYRLVVKATTGQTTVIFHSAFKEALHKLVYQSGTDAGRPRYVWRPGETIPARVHLTNLGSTPYARSFALTLTDDQAHEIWNRPVQVSVPANGEGDLVADIDTKGLKQGVYLLKWASSESADGIQGQLMLTVADDSVIPKAKDGEFLYGIDIGGLYDQPNLLDWADWCGADVIRNAARDQNFRGIDLENVGQALDAMDKHHLKANIMFYPNTPWDKDPAKFDQIIQDSVTFPAKVAEQFKGRFLWYEFGNEPSLQPFFFHGSPADYAKFFSAWSDAIKAVDPSAKVTNGGYAFAGAGGAEQRALEMTKLIPADKIDGWAYHGHGVGAQAERYFFGKMKADAEAAGKGNKPYYETESGETSTDPVSWRSQARTLIQKLSFAQSTHVIPCFLWFGFHPLWEWGILQNFQEAKPAALAYRVLVQRTRGLKAQDRLDLNGAPGEAYWWTGDQGQLTIVMWSDRGEYARTIALGAGSTDVKLYDMFGNPTPLTPNPDGTVQVQVGLDPVYICATRPTTAPALTVQPPPLDLPETIRVVPGTTASLPVTVHNHSASSLDATVTVKPSGAAPITAAESRAHVDANGQVAVKVPLTISDVPISWWPRAWSVFAPVVGNVDLSTFTSIPDSITSDGKPLAPQVGIPNGTDLDLAPLGGGFREKRQAFCFAQVTLDADTDVEVGISADYWMEWWINGKRVFSTMDAGNGATSTLLGHVIPIHLQKGPNLFAIRVLSGSGGWKLVSGGPDAIAQARRALSGISDIAVVELKSGDQVLDHEAVRIEPLPPLLAGDEKTAWNNQAPDGSLGAVENYFKAAPDQTHWYHGRADLSGRFWFRVRPDGALLIEAAITDDIDKPGDAIHVHLASGDDWKKRVEISSGQPEVTKRRDEATTTTWYEVIVPPQELGVSPLQLLAINITVDDDDWGELKQRSSMMPGDDPSTWYQTWLPK